MVPFSDIPLVDGHAHPPLRPELAAREPFARFFTEAPFAEANTLFYRQALRELAARAAAALSRSGGSIIRPDR